MEFCAEYLDLKEKTFAGNCMKCQSECDTYGECEMRYVLVSGFILIGTLGGCISTTSPIVVYQSENVISFTHKSPLSTKGRMVTPEMRDLAAKHCNASGANASYKGYHVTNIWTDESQHDFTCERGKVEIIE